MQLYPHKIATTLVSSFVDRTTIFNIISIVWFMDWNYFHPQILATKRPVATHYAVQLFGVDRIGSGSANTELLMDSQVTSCPGMCVLTLGRVTGGMNPLRRSPLDEIPLKLPRICA